jgi:small subunit ribosomal protein S6
MFVGVIHKECHMAQAQVLKSKEYETIYILRSDVDADTAERVQSRIAEVVGRDSGKLVKVESWGRRKLAYPVAKQKKGVYVYVKYVGRGGLVQEIERNLKLQDAVLKFQTVMTNPEVDLQALAVDPEEVKFQRLDLPPEEEEKESREKALGLVDFDGPRSARADRHDDEFGEGMDGAGDELDAADSKDESEEG